MFLQFLWLRVNPSFYEGWSTTVEEAKSIGVPLLLSDIPVHREHGASFLIQRIRLTLLAYWILHARSGRGGPHIELEAIAARQLERRCLDFGNNFLNIATQTIARYR